jgi:hypothetical protein
VHAAGTNEVLMPWQLATSESPSPDVKTG